MALPESFIRVFTDTYLTGDIDGFMKLIDQDCEWVLMVTGASGVCTSPGFPQMPRGGQKARGLWNPTCWSAASASSSLFRGAWLSTPQHREDIVEESLRGKEHRSMSTVLVTGGTGGLGSQVVTRLLHGHHEFAAIFPAVAGSPRLWGRDKKAGMGM